MVDMVPMFRSLAECMEVGIVGPPNISLRYTSTLSLLRLYALEAREMGPGNSEVMPGKERQA